MKLSGQAVLLRVFVGEADASGHKPLYEQIVLKARELNIAGATVTRGIMGYGASSRLHTAKVLRLSEDLPVVVELVDSAEKLQPLLAWLDEHVSGGLVTMEKVDVIAYRPGKNGAPS